MTESGKSPLKFYAHYECLLFWWLLQLADRSIILTGFSAHRHRLYRTTRLTRGFLYTKKRSAVWQNTFVQSCHLQQQRFAALYFVVSEYHGKSKELITASVFRITSADNSIIQQKTCKAKLYRFFGTPEGTRTPDLLVRSDAIFFSYLFIKCKKFWYTNAFTFSHSYKIS